MRILVLGGTRFCGRHLAELAVSRGTEVTLLHRGAHAYGLPEGVRSVLGDRDPEQGDGLARLAELVGQGERWDAVVDMCGYVPRVVRASTDLLAQACARYVFVSTVSVYQSDPHGAHNEGSPVAVLADPTTESMAGGAYGGLKGLCEGVIRKNLVGRHTIVRPSLIIGPGDQTDRFTYWPRRLSRGGRVLVPRLDAPAQWIDARDLAGFLLLCAQGGIEGTYNAAGPAASATFGSFLKAVTRGIGADCAELEVRDDRWLADHGVSPWSDLPVYPGGEDASIARVDSQRARNAGLTLRSLEATARDTLAWDQDRGSPELKAGLSVEREAQLLEG